QWSRASTNQPGSSAVTVGICGCLSLILLATLVFFGWALTRGVKDLYTPLYFARGTVFAKPPQSNWRRSGGWLRISLEYLGTDVERASEVTEEQQAASADRSQIIQPRFASD